MTAAPRIFLSAGEASGDHYGAQLIAELRSRTPQAAFFGLGGLEMAAEGFDRIVRAEDVAHMGITEVIRHMPSIYGKYRRLIRAIRNQRPDIAVLIDFPDVNFRLARELKRQGVPVVYFVSPQLWAWKRSRLRWVQQRVARMLVIFPFEAAFYRDRGVSATFVGHPLAELTTPQISRADFAALHHLDPAKHWIALLPGSRWKEIVSNLPVMVELTRSAPFEAEYILPVASTIDRGQLAAILAAEQKRTDSAAAIRLVPDAREALTHARASVVASGTATVQAAVIGNPFIVVYRVSPLTFRIAKKLVRYPPEIPAEADRDGNLPVAMVNLIAGRRVVPELLQDRYTAENVSAALSPLISESPERRQMIADLATVRESLLPAASSTVIHRVADVVEDLLKPTPSPAVTN